MPVLIVKSSPVLSTVSAKMNKKKEKEKEKQSQIERVKL